MNQPQTFTITATPPAGFQFTGEFRHPRPQEWFLSYEGSPVSGSSPTSSDRLILRKLWTPAPWMPKNAWLYRWGTYWYVSAIEPNATYDGYVIPGGVSVDAQKLAAVHGRVFVPPPCDKVRLP